MKVHFEMKDNVLSKQLNEFIDEKHFKTRTRLHFAIDDMIEFIADNFIKDGDKFQARRMLEQHNNQIRRSDALMMTFFGGCSLIMFLFTLFFLFIPSSDSTAKQDKYIEHSNSVSRLCFFFVYILFAVGFCIQVFVYYGVNYLYIFELDPQQKMTHHQFYKIGFVLLFIYCTCFAFSLMETKLVYIFFHQPMWLMVGMLFFFIIYCIQPCFGCGYRTARYQLLVTMKEILISPFGRVRFRDFFFADVITSMGEPLKDIGHAAFYIYYIQDVD